MTAISTQNGPRPAGWPIVARQEISDLWQSSKGLAVLFGFSVLMAVLAYIASADAGINLLDARESVGIIVQNSFEFIIGGIGKSGVDVVNNIVT